MKKTAKKLLSMALVLVMVLSLLPVTAMAEGTEGSTESAGSGAFGISTPSAMTEDEQKAAANNPFGAMGAKGAFPLLVKSELYITYGWDGNNADNGVNYVKSYDATDTRVLPQFNINGGDKRIGYNKNDVGLYDNTYMAASVDGFDPGTGKDEYVALLGLNARSNGLELSLTNKQGQCVSDYVMFYRGSDNNGLSWLTGCSLHQMNGFLSVACGDFDGDGMDSIIMYEVGAGNSQVPSLRECTVRKSGSSYDIETGTFVVGKTDALPYGLFSLLGDASDMTKTEAKNAAKVQMEAADTDKDGYDELVVTVSMNDTHYGERFKQLGTQVFIFDKLSSGWTLTARFSIRGAVDGKEAAVAPNKTYPDPAFYADAAHRMVWGTSTVGNVIASDDSGGSTDFPEIVTVGLQDNENSKMHNINVDGNDKLVYSVIHCTGMTVKQPNGMQNYQGTYEAVAAGNLNANEFTKSGFYESEDVSPLLQTKCFSYKGAAEADAVFISGSIFTWKSDANGGGKLEHLYTLSYYNVDTKNYFATDLDKMQVESVAAGNFDGNPDGREQIVSAFLLKEEDENNGFSGIITAGWYPNSTNGWIESQHPGGLCISKMGKAYVALTDFDCDADSVIVEYEGVEKQWSDPNVMAVLAASPYFHDIGLDNNSCTDYGIDRSTETSSDDSHTLTTNFVVGYEASTPLGNGGGVEATIENNLTWSSNKSRTITYSTNYSNNTEEHQVVVYRSPILVYKFKNVNNGEKVYLSKALNPVTTMISLEEYNEQAASGSYGLNEFDESNIGTPGIPNTYPSAVSQIKNAVEGSIMTGDTNMSNYAAGGVISKGVSTGEMSGKSFNYEFDFSFTAYGLIFGAKVGGGAGYGYETTTSVANGTEINRSGTVDGSGVPENYDFHWNFATWTTLLNGLSIPVCGYLVQNVTAPPSPAEDLRITDITASSLTLQWDAGVRPAEKYNIYRVLEESTDPYLYIGSVSGDGEEFSYSLKGLDSGTTYTFVVRGAAGDKESVDGLSATACTSLTGGSSITINPLQSTYSVAPSDSVTLSTTIFTSADFASLQPVWQCRPAGKSNWVNLDPDDDLTILDTSLTLSNVSKSMDGNQYRLRVKATTTSTNVGYYYSNVATLSVSTTDTAATLSITGATDGKGTLSPFYAPYTGSATSTVPTPVTEDQNVDVPATFTVGNVEGQVYKAGTTDNPVYIGEIELDGAVKYYALTKNADETYSAAGDALTVTEKYIDGSGNSVTMPTGGTPNPVTITVGSGESAVTYNAVALWNDAATDAAAKYKEVWFQEQDGYYYTYDGTTFTEIDLDADAWSAYTVLGNISYSDGSQVVVSGSSTYLISGLGGGEGDVPTLKLVSSRNDITVGEATYSLSNLDPVTVTQTVTVITGYETETVNGTALNLSATLKKANSSQVLSGVGANFVITDQATGISQYIAKTSGTDGKISASWTAPAAGLYAIQVSITGTTTLGASLTAPQYYYASSQSSETQYRLRLQANSADVAGSIVYGSTIALVPESKTGTGEWAALDIEADSSLSLTAGLQGGTVSTLDGISYYPAKAGKYTFSLVKTDDTTSTTLATATLNVTPYKLTVTPVWEGTIPSSLNAVTLKFTDASGNRISSLPNTDDMAKLTGALVKSTTYNFINPGAGVFYVNLSWSTDSGKQSDITALNGAYSITLASASFYKKANAMPVNYSVVDGLGGTMFATGSDYRSFLSGEAQSAGTPLRFQATPDTGYYVRSWKVNGNEVAANSPYYVITQISGGNTQMLTISSFDTSRDVSNGALLVEVEFTNQLSTVTYSAAEHGSLTAKTSQGTAVQSGAKLAYGADLVFTAVPDEGYMVKEWKLSVNGEVAQTYTWPENGDIYRENTLTLSDLAENSYTVYVEFAAKQTFEVAAPVFVDNNKNPVSDIGTITMTDASGNAVSAGDKLEQGKAITYTVNFTDSNFNTVNAWEYSTDGTNWTSDSDGGQLTYTCCKGGTGKLYVRAVVSVAQTYALSWSVSGCDTATLTAKSGAASLTNGGSYAVNAPVTFTLELDDSYYVVKWEGAAQSSTDPKSATLTLTDNTTVTVTVAKKPVISWTATNGNVSVADAADNPVSNGGYVDYDATITVTLTPNKGFEVSSPDAGWTAVSNSDAYTYTITNVQADKDVTPTFAAIPTATVTYSVVDTNGSEAGGTNGSLTASITRKGMSDYAVTDDIDGTEPVYRDSVVTFTATPADGYKIGKWFVDGVEQSTAQTPTLTITDTTNRDVQVQFDPVGEAVTYGFDPAGATDHQASLGAIYQVNGSTEQDTFHSGNKPTANGTITFTVSGLAEGYEVEGWYVNGVKVDGQTGLTYAYSVTANVGAEVLVKIIRSSYTVTFSGENGTVAATADGTAISSGDSVVGDTEVIFIAAPVSATGYTFAGWTVDGEASEETTESLTLTIAKNTEVKASYTLNEVRYTVTHGVIGETGGTLTVTALDAENTAAAGSNVVFKATPADGYRVKGWYSDAAGTMSIPGTDAEQNSYTLKNLLANASVYVAFEPIPTYDITVTVTGLGTVTATVNGEAAEIPAGGILTVTRYDDVVLTATPDSYQYLTGWTLDGADQGNGSMTLTLTDVTGNHTVTAGFAASQLVEFRTVCGENGSLTAQAGYGETLSSINASTGISLEKGKKVVVTADPADSYMVAKWTVNGTDVTRDNMAQLGVTLGHYLSNTLTVENLSGAMTIQVSFETYTGYTIPTGDTGYTVTGVERNPNDTTPETEIRENGDLSFTISPDSANEYSTISSIKLGDKELLSDDPNDNITVVKNSNGSYTVTITGVQSALALTVTAHKLVITSGLAGYNPPTALEDQGLDTPDKIQAKLETKLTASADGKVFYDIALKYKDGDSWVEVTEANFPANGVDVVLPYPDGSGRNDIFTIVHMLTTQGNEGKLEIITHEKETDGLHFHVNSLSPFAVSWTKYTAPTGGGGGGGGGGAAAPAETIVINDSVNGKVTADNTCAEEGDKVTLTVTPDKGYTLETLTVTDGSGKEVKLTEKDGKYTFTMPASDVTIKATFMEDNSMLNFFVDVPADAYYYDAVLWAAKEGITGGVDATHFAPYATCTRAQAVTFLWRAAGSPAPENSAMPFTDVAEGSYYHDAVLWAVENGITKGTTDTTFSPNAKCTRAQIVTFLHRSVQAQGGGLKGQWMFQNPFTDVSLDSYYGEAVMWAVANGVTGGTTATTFSPNSNCTRAQIVTFLYRSMK